jgi:hypothetical protein
MAMSAPEHPLGGDLEPLLPPEVAVDEPPVPVEDFDLWHRKLAEAAANGLDTEGDNDPMPESLRAFATAAYDPDRAEWAMASLAERKRAIAEQEARRDAYKDKIDRWFAKATAGLDDDVRYFEGVLTNMLRQAHDEDPNIKSVSLPSGSITSTGPTPGNELVAEFHPVGGEVDVLQWAKQNKPDLVHVKEWVNISEVRKAVWRVTRDKVTAAIGEGEQQEIVEVPGLVAFERRRTFTAKPIV